MKFILLYVIPVFALYSSAFAQSTFELKQSANTGRSLLFQAALEAGITGGETYEDVSDSPFQFGLRIGMHGFVSNSVAIGGGVRASTIPFGDSQDVGWGFGIGPEIVISGNNDPARYGFFATFHTYYARQKLGSTGYYNPFWGYSGGGNSESAGGLEIGARIGGMRLLGGAMYGGGLAFELMNDAPDGARIYLTLGIASSTGRKAESPEGSAPEQPKKFLFELSVEPGFGFGDLYDYVSEDNPQIGFRINGQRLFSRNAAVGVGMQFSISNFDEKLSDTYGFGFGPNLLILLERDDRRYTPYVNIHGHYVIQKLLYQSGYGDASGIELCATLGMLKFASGNLTFGVGAAYQSMKDYEDGYRIFIRLGLTV